MLPAANGQCSTFAAPIYRLYNGRWMHNDSNHRYVTNERVRAEMIARGWTDEGARFCATSAVEVPFKAFNVEIALSERILPAAQCEDESRNIGSCLAVNNLPVPSLRMGPYGNETREIWAAKTGLHSPEVYAPGAGYGATPEAIADGIFVNGSANWVGIHIQTRGRDASSLASMNPLYQMRTTPGSSADERFFPFAPHDLPATTEISIQFSLYVRRLNVHDASSHAYGHPTVAFIDVKSGEDLYFSVLAYGRPTGADFVAPDVTTGTVIVGTEFRPSTLYGRSIGAAALSIPPGFDGPARGDFDFRMDRSEFQRVIDDAQRINPRLSSDPSDYLVANFHFKNEVVGNAEIGAALGGFSLRLMPAR